MVRIPRKAYTLEFKQEAVRLVESGQRVFEAARSLGICDREQDATLETMKHTTLATARLRFLFLAARIWRHAGRVGVSYSDHYQEKELFQRLMERLRRVAHGSQGFAPVLPTPLRA